MMPVNTIKLDTSGMEKLMAKLARLEHETAPDVLEKIFTEVGEKIGADTVAAVQPGNLPRGGKYSRGSTAAAAVAHPVVTWEGMTAEMAVGFDFSKPGAGGYLIKGRWSPSQMSPAPMLNMMFANKRYLNAKRKEIEEAVLQHIADKMTE